jgi:hypothetical protein
LRLVHEAIIRGEFPTAQDAMAAAPFTASAESPSIRTVSGGRWDG